MIHSGSRNIGLKVANHYNKIAQYWNEKWYSEMVSGLAYLPMETQMAKDYFREMNYCVAFAFANRQLMMTRICEAIQAVKPETDFDPMINIAHNYAAWENHFDQDVIVHRKVLRVPMRARSVLSPDLWVPSLILLRDWVIRRVSKAVRMVQAD